MIYLDNAATTLKKPPQVYEAMLDTLKNCANAGRGGYDGAMVAAERIYSTREKVAELFGASGPEQVVFTNNATHSLNIAIKGIVKRGKCVISSYEHNSVVRPVVEMKKTGVTFSVAQSRLFNPEETVSSFVKKIDKNTSCVICTHESNVFGYILPVKEIDSLCFEMGIPLIIDASQSAGSIDIKMSDFRSVVCICAPGHKGLYGPQGTGVLVCREGESLTSLIQGGTGSLSGEFSQPDFMPDRHESGTHNTPGIAGLGKGVEYVIERTPKKIMEHEQSLIRYAAKELMNISGIKAFISNDRELQGGVLSFVSETMSADELAFELSKRGIAVRSGLHCSALAHRTIGTKLGTVRISVSDFSTETDVEGFVVALRRIGKYKNI